MTGEKCGDDGDVRSRIIQNARRKSALRISFALQEYLSGESAKAIGSGAEAASSQLCIIVDLMPDVGFEFLRDALQLSAARAGHKLIFLEAWGIANGELSLMKILENEGEEIRGGADDEKPCCEESYRQLILRLARETMDDKGEEGMR